MAKKNGAFPNFSTYITNIVLLLHYNYLKAILTSYFAIMNNYILNQ